MKFGLILLFGVTSLLAAGCATHQKAPGATFDRIGQEMQGAVEATAKGSADSALNQAMLYHGSHSDYVHVATRKNGNNFLTLKIKMF